MPVIGQQLHLLSLGAPSFVTPDVCCLQQVEFTTRSFLSSRPDSIHASVQHSTTTAYIMSRPLFFRLSCVA
jgi:hypothetical protein